MIVVGGNNVMGSRPDGWWKDRPGAVRRLVAQIGEWAADRDEDVLVIFDGSEPDGLEVPPRLEVRFATRRVRDAADDDIAAFAVGHDGPLRVVTSDRDLARRVGEHGAEVVGARHLLDQL